MNKKLTRVVSAVLCAMMIATMLPMTAFAASFDTVVTDDYYSIISKHEYTLAPGAKETELVLNNSAGSRRQIAHVMEIDTKNPTIQVLPGYYGIDKLDPNNLNDSTHWTDARVTQTVEYYEDKLGYNVVGAMNTALAYDSNAPYDFMMYNGVVLSDPANHSGNAQTYLAVKKNGDCELRSRTEPFEEDDYNVVAANFGWLVKDGELVTKTPERTTAAASRSMLGIKADGTLVIAQFDGRVTPTATGLSTYEMGEMMLALGCVNAVNGDGGGSSTFVTKREGEETHTMRSIPSDGSERPTINSIMVVSTASATGVFDHSVIEADFDYFSAKSTYDFTAIGIDTAGFEMNIPADVEWTLSDASFGTVNNGTFTSNGKIGTLDIQMVYNNKIVASRTINVVNPDFFGFAQDSTVIPYGKKVDVAVTATYGSDNALVYLGDQYTLELSDPSAATLNGTTLFATTDETMTGVEVTATYLPDTSISSILSVTFGKGSEIIFDFEDGDVSDWMGFDEAKQYSIDNGINNTLVGSKPLSGQYSDETDSRTFLATSENGGQVRNGKCALAWEADYTNAAFASWTYNVLFYVGGSQVLRDVANGKNATKLGMWLYIPEGAAGLAFQSQLYVKNDDGSYACKQAHFNFTTKNGTVKNLNSCTEADIPESRWVYASIDLTAYDFICMPDPADTSNSRSPSVVRTYVKPTAPSVYTFYIDDITLDYSSAVDDRISPTISDVSYIPADESVALDDNAKIVQNTMAFSATVADNMELDNSTAKISVDGVAVESAKVTGKHLICENVTLTNGTHTVTFEIKDKLGNLTKVTRTFTVGSDDSDALISLSGHNDSNTPAEYDSIYYVDINTADIESVDGITTTLHLQTANNWEIEGLNVLDGYEATAEVNEITNNVTVNVKKVRDTGLTGVQTLVSIPVRVWSWDALNHITGEPIDPETQFATGNNPIVTIDYNVVNGVVDFSDNSYNDYFATFGGKVSVATNINDSENPWHYHNKELKVLNEDATCITAGYKDRTYCEACKSVIDWGTVVESIGHIYEDIDGLRKCGCGKLFNGEYNGMLYADGKIVEDWFEDSYYVNGKKITGLQKIDDYYYDFGTDGICENRVKYSGLVDIDGVNYYAIGGKLTNGWQQVEDNWYYFSPVDGAGYNGTHYTDDAIVYEFDNGKLIDGVWVKMRDGYRYWYGPSYYKKFTASATHNADPYVIDGDTYFFDMKGYMQTGVITYRDTLQQIIVYYDCGTDGKAKLLTGPYNGYFYKDGVRLNNYQLVKSNEGDFYFIDAGHKYAKSTTLYLTEEFVEGKTYADGTPLSVGYYEFDDNGMMVIKNGPVGDYFYKNNARQTAYQLVNYDGDYYFINDANKLAKSTKLYLSTQFVEGKTYADGTPLYVGYYDFDENGKMIVKNGPIGDYMYKNNTRLIAYQLVSYDGDYYFINDANKLAKSTKLYLSAQFVEGKTFADGTPLYVGYYDFDENGKMVVKNGPIGDYMYKNNTRLTAYQLVNYDGDYYFINDSNKLAKSTKLYLSAQFVEGKTFADGTPLYVGYYDFDEDGKMVVKNGPIGDYMYKNNTRLTAYQLVNYDGDYYFINDANKLAKSTKLYLSTQFVEGKIYADGAAMLPGYYEFDETGKMVGVNGPIGDYFYRNGVRLNAYQLVEYDGNLYFINDGNKITKDKKVWLSAQFVVGKTYADGSMVEIGYHYFDADGKMIVE